MVDALVYGIGWLSLTRCLTGYLLRLVVHG
jgi:hypothetical protein